MKKIMLPALLLLAFVLAPDAGAQDKCGAAKLKAAGKKAYGKAGCYAKARSRGVDVDPRCLEKVELQFSATFDKYDSRGGCLTTGDATAMFSAGPASAGAGAAQTPAAGPPAMPSPFSKNVSSLPRAGLRPSQTPRDSDTFARSTSVCGRPL